MKSYSKEFLMQLYEMMLKIRLGEESLVQPILEGTIKCPVHLYTGEEAIATGVCAHLSQKDYVFGNHRSHGHYLAKGGDLKSLIAEIYGKEAGCARGRGGSMHVIDTEIGMLGAAPIVGGTISLAVGSALASKIRKDKRVSVSFFGDGATGEGVLYESLNFAALQKLPVLFVCENNHYSTHMPILECRMSEEVYDIGNPCQIASERVDGNNVLEVYEMAKKGIESCRNGYGPVFLECVTYRMRGHVGPDDNIQGTHTDIRPAAEVEEWRQRDPIENLKGILMSEAGIPEREIQAVHEKIEDEIAEAFVFTENSPYPDPHELQRYVFRS